jgi:hypothetical protein
VSWRPLSRLFSVLFAKEGISMSPIVVASIAIAVFAASLGYVLRPHAPGLPRTGATGPLDGASWVRRHHSILLSLTRGTLNGAVATFFLLQVGYPPRASVAEGLTAGALSGLFQLAAVNERLAAYLNRAPNEVLRALKWAWVEAIFYGLVKAIGTLAGGGPRGPDEILIAYLMTVTFSCAQYPWEAAIAAGRQLRVRQGQHRDRIRFVADVQTMAVSMTCLAVSVLNSVGVPGSRVFLTGVAIAGIGVYCMVRLRCAPARRPPAWTPMGTRISLGKN